MGDFEMTEPQSDNRHDLRHQCSCTAVGLHDRTPRCPPMPEWLINPFSGRWYRSAEVEGMTQDALYDHLRQQAWSAQ